MESMRLNIGTLTTCFSHLSVSVNVQENPAGFMVKSPMALLRLWNRLESLTANVVNAELPFDPIDRFIWANLPYAVEYNGGQRFRRGQVLDAQPLEQATEVRLHRPRADPQPRADLVVRGADDRGREPEAGLLVELDGDQRVRRRVVDPGCRRTLVEEDREVDHTGSGHCLPRDVHFIQLSLYKFGGLIFLEGQLRIGMQVPSQADDVGMNVGGELFDGFE